MEVWKSINGFEDYQISNYGRVKSLKKNTEKILKSHPNEKGYYKVDLYLNNKRKTIRIHKLVSQYFLNHIGDGTMKLVIDHIDNDKSNNRVDNLQIVTNRQNSSKTLKRKIGKTSSQYVGVTWCKNNKKWIAQIQINKKRNHLGCFINEYDAHLTYQNKLKEIDNPQ
jgi:hypothetical protein